MREKEAELQPIYIKAPDGSQYEKGRFPKINSKILIHGDSDEYLEDVAGTGSFTCEINIENLKHVFGTLGELLGKVSQNNNWRKLHGLQMRRRKWLRQ